MQSKETIEANNDNENENVSEEDDVQEYEPETGDEAERPPQVHLAQCADKTRVQAEVHVYLQARGYMEGWW